MTHLYMSPSTYCLARDFAYGLTEKEISVMDDYGVNTNRCYLHETIRNAYRLVDEMDEAINGMYSKLSFFDCDLLHPTELCNPDMIMYHMEYMRSAYDKVNEFIFELSLHTDQQAIFDYLMDEEGAEVLCGCELDFYRENSGKIVILEPNPDPIFAAENFYQIRVYYSIFHEESTFYTDDWETCWKICKDYGWIPCSREYWESDVKYVADMLDRDADLKR